MVDPISEEEIRERFDMRMFLGACHRGFTLFGTGELNNPERREWVEKDDDSFHLVMEAEWSDRYRARKTIDELSDVTTGQLGERRAVITLTDLQAETELEMDADLVTDMRTGAAAAWGLKYLRPSHLRRLAIVGTGRVALRAALACDELFDIECIVVTSRNRENRERFAAQASSASARIELAPDIDRCVADADAIVAAVPTPKPVLSKAHVEGRMLVAMGGDSRTRQLAPEILRDLVILPDHLQQTLKAGEFRHARADGELDSVRFARDENATVLNMGDAACERLGAVRPQVVYLTGLAALDLCAAVMIYEGLRKGRNT